MQEQVTFAVDPNGGAHYVHVTSKTRERLNLPNVGATIDTRNGGFPDNLQPGFYEGTLKLSESSVVQWNDVHFAEFRTK